MGVLSRAGVGDSKVRSGIIERLPGIQLCVEGRVRAVVTDMETDKVIQRIQSKNTVVTSGVASLALQLLPQNVYDEDDAAATVPNIYHSRPLNEWRMGGGSGDHLGGSVTAPADGDADLEDDRVPVIANGDGPWTTELDGSNFFIKKQDGNSLIDPDDQDVVDAFTIKVTMSAAEGSGAAATANGSDYIAKTYLEVGLFYSYSGFVANGDHQSGERLFARSTIAPLTKTPTRQIDLSWDVRFYRRTTA